MASGHSRVSAQGLGQSAAKATIARMRSYRWEYVALITLCIAVLFWAAIHFLRPSKPSKPGVEAAPVGVAKAASGNMNVELEGLGTVTPISTVTVQTQINGQLVSVGYREGQLVKQGDFLAQIDPRPYEVALEQARGALAHDTGLLNQARSDLARYLVLKRENAIADQVVSDQEFLVQQDTGTVLQDQANVNNAKLNLTYCHIVSPVTGRAGLRLVDPGNYVQAASSTGLVVLTVLRPITVVFVLPEDNIPAVARQLREGHTLPVTALDRSDTKIIAQGTLTSLDNTVDTTTGTVKLRATFPNNDFALFPNGFVNARLQLETLRHVLEIPARAVQTGAPGTFVYVVRPNHTVHVQVVKTGVTNGDNVQIASGLKPGDTVVTDGIGLLREGAAVRISPEVKSIPTQTNTGPGAPPGEQAPSTQTTTAGQVATSTH